MNRIHRIWMVWLLLIPLGVNAADSRMYHCELGLQAGVGYYVGDATPHIFMNPLDVYGAQFRYKFNYRWALQVKAQRQRIGFRSSYTDEQGIVYKNQSFYNAMWNADIVGEFNFFHFGQKSYDSRIKTFTPYMFLGLGVSTYNKNASHSNKTLSTMYPTLIQRDRKGMVLMPNLAVYIPLGIGLKWKVADRCQLQLAWQQQIYFVDNLEGRLSSVDDHLNDPHGLNGKNILNCDFTSNLMLSVVVEFAKKRKYCARCEY